MSSRARIPSTQPSGQEDNSPGRYNPPAMPTAYLIGRDGRIKMVHQGYKERDAQLIEKAVVDALGR